MQSLDEKKRDIFEVVGEKGLFSVEKQSIKLSERDLSDTGQIPVFSSQTSNNGVMGFTNKVADFFIKDTPALIFGDHTKSMDISNHSFCAADNVKVLRPQNIPFDALFYVSCAWKKRIPDMGYARHWRKAKKVGIELPVTDSGEPDYAYMAEYAQQKRNAMLAKYRAYVEARIAELGEVAEIPALDEKGWRAFHLEEIGTVTSGRDIYAAERVKGNTPYITSGGTNNGVGYFVGNINDTLDSGYIALNRNGTVGKAFYHPSKSLMGNDCRKIHLKDADRNLFVGQFVSLCLSMQSECFSYSRKLGTARAKRMQVMLPVTDSGEPDYEYMEQYSKNMMLRKYQQYLTFLQQRSNA